MTTPNTPSAQPISIKIDSASILERLREIGQDRQGPYILSRTINLLGKMVQKNLRLEEEIKLNLRRKSWVLSQVKIENESWSTKTKLKVVINLSDAVSFISRLETAETKHPLKKFLMVPNVKVFGKQIITRENALNIHQLRLHDTPNGLQGDQRTFMRHSSAGTPLILQRIGKDTKGKGRKGIDKSTGLRVLYYGIREAKIPKKLHWYGVAAATVQENQASIFNEVLRQALSKGRS